MWKWSHAYFEVDPIGLKFTFLFPRVIVIYDTAVLPAFIKFDPKRGILFSNRLFFTVSPEYIREIICGLCRSQNRTISASDLHSSKRMGGM
jgi:hypothetical protein